MVMLSSQFNSGYRHQLLKKPLVKGFFDAFIFKVYEKCTILALSKIVLVREKPKQERRR